MNETERRAVVLLSGGVDSATTLAIARSAGFDIYALSFAYGQRHGLELKCARRIAESLGARQHVVAEIDLRVLGGSALTADMPVPKDRSLHEIPRCIPITYVPARNTIFLAYALAWAEVLAADDIFIGVNATDYSGYPDCRPEYIAAFEAVAALATKASAETGRRTVIHTPLIRKTKGETIRLGHELGVDYSITSSCYDPNERGEACGRCDSCTLRLKGFAEAGSADPIRYAWSVVPSRQQGQQQ